MSELMKAVVVHEYGGREVLSYEDVPVPEPGPGQVLCAVHAVSVNRTLDIIIRQGTYDGPAHQQKLPVILGIDPSGTVVKIGEGVERLKVGDRIAGGAVGGNGGYAQYALMSDRSR